MMRSLVFLGLVALAACGAPEQRVDTEGQAARAEMDTATAAFADCIEAQAAAWMLQANLPDRWRSRR